MTEREGQVQGKRFLSGLSALALTASGQVCAQSLPGCIGMPVQTDTVVAVPDGETLRLAGGQEVRLIGLHTPALADVRGPGPATWRWPDAARMELSRRALGARVELHSTSQRTDRWGRLMAQAVIAPASSNDPPRDTHDWLQAAMIQAGLARVFALTGPDDCTQPLLDIEAEARDAHRGLWVEPVYAVKRADDRRELKSWMGSFQIWEGRVAGVNAGRLATYVNFGPDRARVLSIGLGTVARRTLTAAGHDARTLKGRIIRVRGWLEWRGGPYIDIDDGAGIEIIGASADTEPAEPARGLPRRRARTQAPQANGPEPTGPEP